jgi:Spy/CpxP family protein refolding chaperone
MKRTTTFALAAGTTLAIALAAITVNAQPRGGWDGEVGYGMGAGYPMGYGAHMGDGAGPGAYGMGPGMMYGERGMGPGASGAYGAGCPWGTELKLTDEQRTKIADIRQDLRSKQWELMGKIRQEFARRAQASDDDAAAKADDQIGQLQQQMLANATAARKQMDAVLTKDQRQQLRRNAY